MDHRPRQPGRRLGGYAPLSDTYNAPDGISGLHPWVRLLIWLALILVRVIASVYLLRSSPFTKDRVTDE